MAARPSSAPAPTGRAAIALANQAARAPSRADGFVGGMQVFAWSPGRVFEIWTAPLRVTTLTLGEGETLAAKAAGDTVRWQIGETSSGAGAGQRTHVLLKPLERGLETNLVLTTSRRVYLLNLKSGSAEAFNAAVAWDYADDDAAEGRKGAVTEERSVAEPLVTPQGPLDARYRIEPRGRRARWTPSSVFNDGLRTFIAFDADLEVDEAPVLFVLTPDGEAQLVNYRQQGGLFVVDRVFDRAELRLGDRRPQVVRIHRLAGAGR
ncbi:Conjugal transfer protein [compost metagenome]